MEHGVNRYAEQYDYTRFTCVLVGDRRSGKTTFIRRHSLGIWEEKYVETTDPKIYPSEYYSTEGPVRFNTWDLPGRGCGTDANDSYYAQADCAIIMCDLSSPSAYQNVRKWYDDIRKISECIPIVICGNKFDLLHVEIDGEYDVLEMTNTAYTDISAKTYFNYDKPFLLLFRISFNDESLRFFCHTAAAC